MTDQTKTQLIIHDSAAHKVQSLIDEEENSALCLRVYIMGGGCSGFQYGFSFDETINDDDHVIEKCITHPINDSTSTNNEEDSIPSRPVCVKVLVDSLSMTYLKDAEIDYREDIQGSQFIIRNPNAKTTCGCGSSFSA